MATQVPVTDEEICGDVPIKTIEPSSGEVSTSFTPINSQEDTAPIQGGEGDQDIEKDTAKLDVNDKTSPKKRAASNAPTGAKTSPTKKRAAPKSNKKIAPKPAEPSDGAADVESPPTTPIAPQKPATKAKAKKPRATKAMKQEPDTDADELAGSGHEPTTTPTPTPTKKTPKKPKAAKKAPAAKPIKQEPSPEQQDNNNDAAAATDDPASDAAAASPTKASTKKDSGTTTTTLLLQSGKPRKRQPPKNDYTRTKAVIPKSYDEASEVDRMLYDLKEAGTGWKVICARYEEMTGEEVGMKSLGSRYARMKANMMRLKPGHALILLQIRQTIEQDFETHKWTQIATALRAQTDENYSTEFLKKQVKELDAKGGVAGLDPEEEKQAAAAGEENGGDGDMEGVQDDGEGEGVDGGEEEEMETEDF